LTHSYGTDAYGTDRPALRVVVVARHPLDGEALASLLNSRGEFHVICTTTSAEEAQAVCQHKQSDVAMLDVYRASNTTCQEWALSLRPLLAGGVLMLDDEIHFGRLAVALETSHLGYFTRSDPVTELLGGLRSLASNQSAYGSASMKYLQKTSQGMKLADQASPLTHLTRREKEVLRLIALGNSVKGCAKILKLAPSTVDNHKSRLMRKLQIHKSSALTRLAIREGLVSA